VSGADDPSRRLAEHLRGAGLLSPAALARAEEARRGTGETLAGALLALGLLAEDALAAALDLPLLRRDDLPAEPPLLDRLASRFLRRARAWPVRVEGGRLLLALADPLDGFAAQAASYEIRVIATAGRG
jgi:general secretion pathway protein E